MKLIGGIFFVFSFFSYIFALRYFFDMVDANLHIEGEPSIVYEIRRHILESFQGLEFQEEGHKYFLHGEPMPSVSKVIEGFVPQTDWDAVAENYAIKNGETAQYWLDKWKFNNLKATTSGTLAHEFGESLGWVRNGHPELITESCKPKYIRDRNWLIPTRPKEEAILRFWDEMDPRLHLVLEEAKVFNTNVNQPYCGTFDLLMYFKDDINPSRDGLVMMDYKGLPLDTPIFTIDGWKTMGTICEGDRVYDKNGELCTVTHTSSIHNNPCYKIKFDNNDEITADCDHRWEIAFPRRKMENGKTLNIYENKVFTTKELKDYLLSIKDKRQWGYIPKIINPKPLKNERVELPIDPYVFGVWLGDGSKSCGIVTNMYDEIWREIEKRGYSLSKDLSKGCSGKAQMRTIYGLSPILNKLGVLFNKHIPSVFLSASYEQRVDLLRGLMDADGYYNKRRKRFVMATNKQWQVDAVVMLLSSLGIKVSVIKAKGKCTNCKNTKYFDKFDITFACDFNPFLLRSVEFEIPSTDKRSYRNVISVEETETVETRCIEVDSPTHTFLCGYNFLVTHNTNRELTNSFSVEKGKMMLPPFAHMYDQPREHYVLQQSLYSLSLREIDLDTKGIRLVWLRDDGTYELVPIQDLSKEEWFKKAF